MIRNIMQDTPQGYIVGGAAAVDLQRCTSAAMTALPLQYSTLYGVALRLTAAINPAHSSQKFGRDPKIESK